MLLWIPFHGFFFSHWFTRRCMELLWPKCLVHISKVAFGRRRVGLSVPCALSRILFLQLSCTCMPPESIEIQYHKYRVLHWIHDRWTTKDLKRNSWMTVVIFPKSTSTSTVQYLCQVRPVHSRTFVLAPALPVQYYHKIRKRRKIDELSHNFLNQKDKGSSLKS